MGSRWTPALAIGLLFLGGVAFAVLGIRQLNFERERAQRRALTRAERLFERSLLDLPRIAADPPGAPIAAWTVVSYEPAGLFEGVEEQTALLFRQAEHLEHSGEADRARGIYDRVVRSIPSQAPLSYVCKLRLGILHHRAGNDREARDWLDGAAGAPTDLIDADGAVVGAAALYHLMSVNPSGAADTWDRILKLAKQGADVSDAPGASEILIELIANGHKCEDTTTQQRVSDAQARAVTGHMLLDRFREDGEGIVMLPGNRVPHFGRRRGERLAVYSVDYASHWVSQIVEPYAYVESGPNLAGAIIRECPAPLRGLSLAVVPRVDYSGSRAALIALVAGLAIYVIGAALAMLAIRRSAKAARMQADFVAAVSHELKTPIASVRAMAEMLAEGGVKSPERAQTYARRIGAEMERLGRTVRNVLDVARIERQGALPLTKEMIDPGQVVEEVTASMRPALERSGCVLDVRCQSAATPMSIDSEALKGVLVNLIDNALKFSPERKHIEVDAAPADGVYRIAVSDRGSGVRSDEGARLFERFFRGTTAKTDAVPGVGLGLHLVREVVNAHGGAVRAAPREGGGSVFTVELRGEEA